jgi:hypothetical protein
MINCMQYMIFETYYKVELRATLSSYVLSFALSSFILVLLMISFRAFSSTSASFFICRHEPLNLYLPSFFMASSFSLILVATYRLIFPLRGENPVRHAVAFVTAWHIYNDSCPSRRLQVPT